MLTGKIMFDERKDKEFLLVEMEVDGKKEWREINTLPIAYQRQIIASNAAYTRYLNQPPNVKGNAN